MKIYPAIDLINGKAVRLFKGKKERARVYGDPIEIARKFSKYFDFIHIVDLDGAFSGKPENLRVVEKIIKEIHIKVEVGGGFRDFESVSEAYDIGVSNVIIGTQAFDLPFLKRITKCFPGITASFDVKGGKIYIKGWERKGNLSVKDAYLMVKPFVNRFIYTSIEKDGTLTGIEEIEKFWKDEEFIYAGGVSSIEDIMKLKKTTFLGAIVGKGIYEKRFSLRELKEISD